jgi:hypothetical protein
MAAMDHLRNLLMGARQVLVLAADRDYIRPAGGFARDSAALRGDAARAVSGLKRTLERHGQQVDHRKG